MSDDGESSGAVDDDLNDGNAAESAGDTFGVGIHVTSDEFQFVVHVPSDIDSGWSDPDAFQREIEAVTWDVLDQRATLQAVARVASVDETVTLGTVTMRPDGEVVDHTLSTPDE
ncbi:hypothetical protein [Halobaculum limi]|uniref:hypothetical protein n=1 Tax=Halobaculum limi TaxID=3031916 RepID=UPI0024062867|nr:hypothetical protein [Halobaculum sp. YSMS11]